jgi:hypothetical protein
MRKSLLAVVVALIGWLAVVTVAGLILRVSWPAYAEVAAAMTFTLPMLLARLAIGAVATLAAGLIAARIRPRSTVVTLIPGLILLALFIPQHIAIWPRFPIWYHLSFLLSLIPLTWAGGAVARSSR